MRHQAVDRPLGRAQVWIGGAKCPGLLGPRQQPQPKPGEGSKRALGADHESLPVFPPRTAAAGGAAEAVHTAVEQHGLHAEHVVARDAIPKAMGAAGVHCDVAADRADRPARRIRRIEQAMRPQRLLELVQGDTAFHFAPEALAVHRANPTQSRRVDDHASLRRHRAARQRRARPAHADRHVPQPRLLKDPHQFIRVGGDHHRIGAKSLVADAVSVVAGQLRRRGQHPTAGHALLQE